MFHSHMRFYVTQWSATRFCGSQSACSCPLPLEKNRPLAAQLKSPFGDYCYYYISPPPVFDLLLLALKDVQEFLFFLCHKMTICKDTNTSRPLCMHYHHKANCFQVNYSGGREGGILGAGVPPGSPKPVPISDKKLSFSTPVFRPGGGHKTQHYMFT